MATHIQSKVRARGDADVAMVTRSSQSPSKLSLVRQPGGPTNVVWPTATEVRATDRATGKANLAHLATQLILKSLRTHEMRQLARDDARAAVSPADVFAPVTVALSAYDATAGHMLPFNTHVWLRDGRVPHAFTGAPALLPELPDERRSAATAAQLRATYAGMAAELRKLVHARLPRGYVLTKLAIAGVVDACQEREGVWRRGLRTEITLRIAPADVR